MADIFTKKKRSEIMSRIRSKNTRPELAVRRALTDKGFRYRLYNPNLPGKPDISIPKTKTVIFINGCFWHQHSGCVRKAVPKSNTEYWKQKLRRNVERQRQDVRALKKLGWNVYKIWECQTKNKTGLAKRLTKIL